MGALRTCTLLAVMSVVWVAASAYWQPTPDSYTCCASGDPHYYLFDGQQAIHFQGDCKYLLAGTCDNCTDRCSDCIGERFHVFVDNRLVSSNPSVSVTDLVEIHYRGRVVVFAANTFPTVDGTTINTFPYTGIAGCVITNPLPTRYVFETNDGVVVSYEYNHRVCVTVPACKYREDMCGICGNMNNIEDDYVTSDGTDVSSDPNKYSLIGNSWEVEGGDCNNTPPTQDYTPSTLIESACCRVLTRNSNSNSSPLAKCVRRHGDIAQKHYTACIYDVSAQNDQSACCDMVEAFVAECLARDVPVTGDWPRSVTCFNDEMDCEPPRVYSSVAPTCPLMCPSGEDCNTYGPGCVCPSGQYLYQDGSCRDYCNTQPSPAEAIAGASVRN